MNEVYFDGKLAAKVPGGWNELTPGQVRMVMSVLYSKIPGGEALVRLTVILLQVWSRPALAWTLLWMDEDGRYDLTLLAEWIFEKKNDRTYNPIRVVKVWRWKRLLKGRWPVVKFYGPADEIPLQCFLEFIKAETYFLRLKKDSGDLEALEKLMAVLYRPGKRRDELYDKGDRREPYDDWLIEGRAKLMRRVPEATKRAVAWFYEGVRETVICPKFREVFPLPPDSPAKEAERPAHRPSGSGWIDQLRTLAGGSLNMDKYANEVDRDIALYDLNMKIAEQREMERNSRK